MLFILTGEVQIGKTRWLSALVDDLAQRGVRAYGVLSPGDWRERPYGEVGGEEARGMAGAGRYEKFGIDCVLLPEGERVRFAERRDLAEAAGSYDGASQSAKAQLGWAIDDAAIARVNAHFETIADAADAALAEGADAAAGAADRASAEAGGADAAAGAADRAFALAGGASLRDASRGLLVVDELGRLELLRGEGFSSAMALLDRGETLLYRTAVVIARDTLADIARERLAPAWGDPRLVSPDDEGRRSIEAALDILS